MDIENKNELSKYRMESAYERLHSAKVLLNDGSLKDSIGRSYYAMFTAARALLILDGIDYNKHSGVISYFQREYVKTGIIDKKYSKYLVSAFQIRSDSDYADFYVVSQQDAVVQYEKAEEFCIMIDKCIQKRQIKNV